MRFPEFWGEWGDTTLGRCAKDPLDYGMNAAAADYDGENKYIRITDIDENSSQYISNNPVSPAGELSDKYIVEPNDILFARTGASTGKTYLYKKEDGRLYFAGFLIRARIKPEHNSAFIFAQTQTTQYQKWVQFMSIRSGQPGINSQEYASYKFLIPKKDEQNKIAKFLSLLDERIATQSQIIEKYESLIKGLTHFILNGKQANVRLKDCVACNSSTLTESEFEGIDGLYPVYGATGIIAYSPQCTVDEDSILVIKDGANVGRVQYVTGKYSTIGTLNYLTVKNGFSLRYIYYLLRCFNFDKYKMGSGIPHVYFKDYGNKLIFCPPIEEQNKIARMLSLVEEKLVLEGILLNAYSLHKQYMLKNIFI
ncbi:MAG: restriction endonuclease subunit S [Mediterranea sp.]|nr:restriction endonuclease subunit S [Mediterranea sp.]